MQPFLNTQTEAITKLSPLKVGALLKRPGTGKSRTAVELIRCTKGIEQVLWLAPFKSVNPVVDGSGIKDEVNKWGGFQVPTIFTGIESLQNSDRIYLDLINKVESKNTFIVCDESLLIKNVDAKRTKRITEIGNRCEHKLILNGTPISRNLLDIKPQFDFLSPLILSMSDAEFKNRYCEYTKVTKRLGYRSYTKEFINKYHNIDNLYSLIKPYIYEADLNLEVGKQHIDLYFSLEDQLMEQYEFLKEKYLDNEKLQFLNNNIFLELTQKMRNMYCCAEEKFELVEKIIAEHGAENVVIYCLYVASREECKKRFKGVTVLSLQADATSINLQSKFVCIEFDKTWDFRLVDQYQWRIYRTGQTHFCYYYYLNGNVKLEGLIRENNNKKFGMLKYLKSVSINELKEAI
jgi:SNF2 family DNA or RNA helicase